MNAGTIERRQSRRVSLEVPIEVREIGARGRPAQTCLGRARNVSLVGCYALLPASSAWAVGTPVSCTVTIPQELTQQFPFVRLVGKGWIVRVSTPSRQRRASDYTPSEAEPSEAPPSAEAPETSTPEIGVAINFVEVTPLTTIGGY